MTDSFNQIQMFLGIGYETSILEACDWDEEECSRVAALFSYEIFEALKTELPTAEAVTNKVKKELQQSLDKRKVEALMMILKDACSNAEFFTHAANDVEI